MDTSAAVRVSAYRHGALHMNKDEAKEKFRLADRLFAEEQFGPALKVLTELNAAFPGERHVLYPMARCLTGLGRNSEAVDLADRVVREFNYAPAIDLYRKLKEMKTGGGLAALESQSDPPNLPGAMKFDSDPIVLPGGVSKFDSDLPRLPSEFDSMVDRPSKSGGEAPPALPAAGGPGWKPLAFWIGLAVASFAALVIVSVTIGRPALEWRDSIQELQGTNPSFEEVFGDFPAGPFAIVLVFSMFTSYILACFPGYWALRIVDALRFNNFGDDMKDVALYTLWGLLLFPVLIIGWIILLVILQRHYELSFGKLCGVVVLWLVFDIGLGIVYQILYTVLVGILIA